jgi:glyoxylase-like metal-dependent hydrolase (beta-lactamase superfamily II)
MKTSTIKYLLLLLALGASQLAAGQELKTTKTVSLNSNIVKRIHSIDTTIYPMLNKGHYTFAAVVDGDTIPLGDETIQVLHVPGHSPGGLAFYLPQSALLISGDTIFNGSVGRTDLWGGDMAQLLSSIREKIYTLPEDTVIASGHGPTTTVADEKRFNPFI